MLYITIIIIIMNSYMYYMYVHVCVGFKSFAIYHLIYRSIIIIIMHVVSCGSP